MRRNLKDKSDRISVRSAVLRTVLLLILAALLGAVYYLPQILISRQAADIYCSKVFPVVAFIPNTFNSLFLISLTENIVVAGGAMLLFLVIRKIVQLIKTLIKRGAVPFVKDVYKLLRDLLIVAICMMIVFQMMHGVNYRRTSIPEGMGLTREEHTYEEYAMALKWAYDGMISARMQLGEDYNGVAHMSTSFEQAVFDANALMNSVSDDYGYGMSRNYVRAKGVMLSHYWSYTDITGFYDMFLGEANLNTDYLDILYFPVTLCHEITHAKGYARESDANTAAVLACIRSPRADFRYAGYYAIFVDLYYKTASYAEEEGKAMPISLSDPAFEAVVRDAEASSAYDESLADNPFTRLVERFSESANNTFLEANGQVGGTKTYIIPTSIYVDYFCIYVYEGD
ncbi:Protein of unknown function [Oscillospiraceae bacterium]|nr:Protein of unknown function [Oscillospiraceae bacterium]